MKNQNDEILADLKNGAVMTQSYAIKHFRCYRLSTRIYDLRALGHNIQMDSRTRISKRTGRKVTYGAYWLPLGEES